MALSPRYVPLHCCANDVRIWCELNTICAYYARTTGPNLDFRLPEELAPGVLLQSSSVSRAEEK